MLLKWIWWTCHALSAPKFKPCYEMPRCLNALCKTPQLKQKLWILGYTGKREKPAWSYDNQELKFPSWAGNHLYPAIVRKNDELFDVTLWQSNMAMESFMSWGEATDKMDTNGALSSARLLQHTSIIIALLYLIHLTLWMSLWICPVSIAVISPSIHFGSCVKLQVTTSNKLIPRNRANRDIVSTYLCGVPIV